MSDLLDNCKTAKSPQDLEALAQRYGVDVPTLESLRNSVNTPAVDPDSVVKTIGADGEERTTVKVILPRLSKYNLAGPKLTRVA